MTWTIRMLAVSALAIVGLSAWADDDKKPFDDGEFVAMVASCDMHQIELGKLAAERAKNEDVKKFAKKTVEGAEKCHEDLKTAAKSAGITVPEKMLDEHRKICDKFKDYKGENFDRDYIKQVVEDCEKGVKWFTRATKDAKSQQLKDFATKGLPVIQAHLDEAKKLQEQIK